MPHQLGQSRNTVILVQPVLLGADGGDGAAVDEQVRAGDEAGVIAQKERARLGDFVGGATALGGRGADHLLVVVTCGCELVVGERGQDRTGADGVGSPAALRVVQQRVVQRGRVSYFNSPDHDNTLTNVAAHKGVYLSPGFLNDRSGQLAWTPFDCREHFVCGVCTHAGEERRDVLDFVETLREVYAEHAGEAL